MDGAFDLKAALVDAFNDLATSVADLVPRAVIAIVVIVLGLLLAKVVERSIRKAFDKFRINEALAKVGVTQTLKKVGLQGTPGLILSRTVYFLLIIMFTQAVTRAVGLSTIADAIGSFFSYLPNLIAAFLVLLLGTIVAQFLGASITRSASESGVEFAPLLGRIVSALVIFMVAIMAISQLKIDTEIIKSVVLVLLAGFALAIALSFGLGSREITRNILAGFYARKLFRVGEAVEMSGQRGILVAITPLQTLIECDDQTLAVPNRVFLEETVKQ